MLVQDFWKRVDSIHPLSEASKKILTELIKPRKLLKEEYFVKAGDTCDLFAYVKKGVLGYYHVSSAGDNIFKKFFPEDTFVGATGAMIQKSPSLFNIQALEDCELLEFSFSEYRKLVDKFPDVAQSYIAYLENNWVVQKEEDEISFRYDTGSERYLKFRQRYPGLEPRLKQHQVASYLGVTPTQLSRIRREI